MIEAKKLNKEYGEIVAAKDVDFQVPKGEVLGFLGPNGAGKTTTMRMLTTFLYPTSGTAVLDGNDIMKDPLKVRQSVGYLPEDSPVYDDMAVIDFLTFAAEARRLKDVSKAVDRVLDLCFIRDVRMQPIHTLSKGYRQRVCFAQAIIHDPQILILDEPTVGLDPNQKAKVRDMISGMSEGKAILLSTHILDEAVSTCNRALIISEGRIKVDDTLENLLKLDPNHGSLRVQLQAQGEDKNSLKNSLMGVDNVRDVQIGKSGDGSGSFEARIYPKKTHDISGPVLDFIKGKNWVINSVTVNEGQLADVFRSFTESQETE